MAKLHLAQEILDIIYPIGSVYISVNTTDPSTLFGGGWTRITGRFLLGADDSTYKNGATGGESTHTLTVDEMASHIHHIYQRPKWFWSDKVVNSGGGAIISPGDGRVDKSYTASNTDIDSTGGGQPHNNMPPYLVVYMWKRTS